MSAQRKGSSPDRAAARVGGGKRRYAYVGAVLALATLITLVALPLMKDAAPPAADAAGGRIAAVVLDGSCPTPASPDATADHKDSGVVMLNFLVGADGSIVDSRVETSSGHPALDEAARSALSRCRFKAGTFNGHPEASWHIMKYDWSERR